MVKWVENIGFASNFLGIGKTGSKAIWKAKKYTEIKRPDIVKKFNEGKGGVDLIYRLINHYGIHIKSRKWTLRMIAHTLNLALVNSWLE